MSTVLSDKKNEFIKEIATNEGLKDFKAKITAGSMKGDGYLGIINTINLEDANKKLHLIMKSASAEEKLREFAPVRKAYEREVYLYDTIFPELKKLSQELQIKDSFTEIAKYYGSILTEQEECLVLENLKEINFKLWNRKLPMNEEHVSLVFSTYAKFHATGTILKLQNPEKFEEFKKNLRNIFYKDNESEEDKKRGAENMKQIFSNGYEAVSNNEKAVQRLTDFISNAESFFKSIGEEVDPYSTILHGDCWCNNMMFKYKDESLKPSEMCFLDWQVSHVGSPVLDLSYFFYASSSKEVLCKLDDFLKIYHEQFSKVIEQSGVDIEKVFTYEELKNQWKKYSKYGLFMALIVMKVILSEVNEAPELSELAKEGKDIIQSIYETNSVNMEAINQRISDVILFMVENNYL